MTRLSRNDETTLRRIARGESLPSHLRVASVPSLIKQGKVVSFKRGKTRSGTPHFVYRLTEVGLALYSDVRAEALDLNTEAGMDQHDLDMNLAREYTVKPNTPE